MSAACSARSRPRTKWQRPDHRRACLTAQRPGPTTWLGSNRIKNDWLNCSSESQTGWVQRVAATVPIVFEVSPHASCSTRRPPLTHAERPRPRTLAARAGVAEPDGVPGLLRPIARPQVRRGADVPRLRAITRSFAVGARVLTAIAATVAFALTTTACGSKSKPWVIGPTYMITEKQAQDSLTTPTQEGIPAFRGATCTGYRSSDTNTSRRPRSSGSSSASSTCTTRAAEWSPAAPAGSGPSRRPARPRPPRPSAQGQVQLGGDHLAQAWPSPSNWHGCSTRQTSEVPLSITASTAGAC